MKKLLFSLVSVFMFFALNAQLITENFSDYTVGGKIAQQAQAMGRDYWTTWSNLPGSNEDGVVDEMPAGNKCGKFIGTTAQTVDQVLRLGTKNGSVWETRKTGVYNLDLKIYIPTGKDGYFNVISKFTGNANTTIWALQVCFATDVSSSPVYTPGVGKIYAGAENYFTFNFSHDQWIPVRVMIDLDNDNSEIYINGTMVHQFQYSLGTFGEGSPREIDVMDIFPSSPSNLSTFYVDDIVFSKVSSVEILHENKFDDKPVGAYVAQSYPEWWTTWANHPGTNEDALISNEQAASPGNSAKCAFAGTSTNPTGTDLVFKAGNKTSGQYTIDFDMYIPTSGSGFFNLLHVFAGSGSEWAIGVYFNTNGTGGMPTGTVIVQNGIQTPFTFPYATWFPVHIDVDLDSDLAKIKINNIEKLTWQFSLTENGGVGLRQLAAVDFYPPQVGSVYYVDNFVYAFIGDPTTKPVIAVTPSSIDETLPIGQSVSKQIKVENTGTSMGEYTSYLLIDIVGQGDNKNFDLTHAAVTNFGSVFYNQSANPVLEVAHKYPISKYCQMVGTSITKISYYLPASTHDNKITARVYGQGTYNTPGALLTEKIVTNPPMGWVDVTLNDPVLLDGQDIWVAFEFIQNTVQDGLMQCDGTLAVENGDWRRSNGGTWSQLHIIQPELANGNWMIKAFAQGKVSPGCWITLTGDTYGSVPKSTSKTFNANLNATGLAEGEYNAKILVSTNDPDNPLFTIPCKLTVANPVPHSLMTADPTLIEKEIKDEVDITVEVKITNTGNAAGGYAVSEPTVDWLTFSGNTIVASIAPGANDVFDVILSADELEDGDYETDIIILTPNDVNDQITISCILHVNKIGVGENSIKTLVFPNPASNNVTVKSTKNISSIQIINFVGQTVFSTVVNKEIVNINTSDLTAGIYFLKINSETGSQNVKLIIK